MKKLICNKLPWFLRSRHINILGIAWESSCNFELEMDKGHWKRSDGPFRRVGDETVGKLVQLEVIIGRLLA